MKFSNVSQVSSWRLCLGCGVCVWACPEGNIRLVDRESEGIRPEVKVETCRSCGECLKVCPGLGISHELYKGEAPESEGIAPGWGPVLEVWEGFAADPEIRFRGSSGGLATALAAYCLEREGFEQVVHTAGDDEAPWKNKTVFSRTREELLRRTGSRYAPASPCEGLKEAEAGTGRSVFVGKPCDQEGLRKAQGIRPMLREKLGLAIGIFCAGTPSTRATVDLLKMQGIDPDRVRDLRYRGQGWPGMFAVTLEGDESPFIKLPYLDAWGFLQKYRPYRCHLCPDGTSEFADVACGDAWHRKIEDDSDGLSLVLVRTERGRQVVEGARKAGYVMLKPANPAVIEQSQPEFPAKRGAVWGRMLAMRLFGIPIPEYKGFYLRESWKRLSTKEKTRSILGTVRRIIQRKYYTCSE